MRVYNHRLLFLISFLVASQYTSEVEASKARLEALSLDKDGSYFLQDRRNVFLNPAELTLGVPYISFEWGNSQSAANVDDLDASESPKPEGALVMDIGGGGRFGLFLGYESDEMVNIRQYGFAFAGANDRFLNPDNVLALAYGNQSKSLSWGAMVLYSSNKQDTNEIDGDTSDFSADENLLVLKGGFIHNRKSKASLSLIMQNEAEGSLANGTNSVEGAKFSGDTSLVLGGSHKLNKDMTIYAEVVELKGDFEPAADTDGVEIKYATRGIGFSHIFYRRKGEQSLTDVFYRAELGTGELKYSEDGKRTFQGIELGIGLERKFGWYTIRGAADQFVLVNEFKDDNGTIEVERPQSNSAGVSAGLGMDLDGIQLDGTIRSTSTARLNASDFLARVSISYNLD